MNSNAETYTGPVMGDNSVFDSAVVLSAPAILGVTVDKTTTTAAKDFPGDSYVSRWVFDFKSFVSTVKIKSPYNIILDIRKPSIGVDRI